MTITSNNPLVHITASAGQQLFAANFEILRAEDAAVFQRADGDPSNPTGTELELNVNYTITGVGNPTGFNVNLLVGAAENDLITIDRDMALDRETSFEEAGTFTAKDLDEEFDKQTMMVQQVYSLIKQRGLTYNVDVDAKEGQVTIPELGAAEFWSANTEGNLVAVKIESTNVDALRSEIASQTELAPGSDDVGCWNHKLSIGQTLTEILEYIQNKQVVPTGSCQLTVAIDYNSEFPADQWVMARDKTIGNSSSNATERANNDTQALFVYLWEQSQNHISFQLYDSGGTPVARGASAINDWNANRQLKVGTISQRSIAIAGNVGGLTPRQTGDIHGDETVGLTASNNGPHTHSYEKAYKPPYAHYAGGDNDSFSANEGATTGSSGSGTPHENIPPTVYLSGFWKL